jgi:type II secretory pathway component PulF
LQSILVNGALAQWSERVVECKFGQMAQFMKAGGVITRHMAAVELFMQMVTYTKEIGRKTGLMATVFI